LETGRNVYIEERCGDWRQVDILKRESGDRIQEDISGRKKGEIRDKYIYMSSRKTGRYKAGR